MAWVVGAQALFQGADPFVKGRVPFISVNQGSDVFVIPGGALLVFFQISQKFLHPLGLEVVFQIQNGEHSYGFDIQRLRTAFSRS